MFNFSDNTYSHMPFVYKGIQLCTLRINNKWKIHYNKDGEWKRLSTTLPADATECSPGMVKIGNKDVVYFIGGGCDEHPHFNLYAKYDFDEPMFRVTTARVGCMTPKYLVYGYGKRFITLLGSIRETLELPKHFMVYRITYNVTKPTELILSTRKDDTDYILTYDIETGDINSLTLPDDVPYKACFYDGKCYYAHRLGKFEERIIKETQDFKLTPQSRNIIKRYPMD